MKNRWKALASVAVAAALVVAPLAVGAASAHTGNLNGQAVCNPQTGQYDITYTLELSNVGAQTTGVTHWGVGNNTFAGTPTDATGLTQGPHDSTGNATFSLGTYSVPGTSTAGPWVYAFTQFSNGVKLGSDGRVDVLAGNCKPADKPVTPPTPTWTDPCGPDNGSWNAPVTEGIEWSYGSGEGKAYITANALPGYVIPENATTEWSGDINDEACWTPPTVIGVPALFAVQPTAPKCDQDGALPTFGQNTPNVTYQINPEASGPGEYVLTVTPNEGFAFDPDNLPAGWGYDPDTGAVSRTLTVLGATHVTQSEDSEAPCFLAVATLDPPTMTDACGTVNDLASLPLDTTGVAYDWASEDPDVYDVLATVADGYAVSEVPEGWAENEDGTFTFAWSPEFTDEACPTVAETPPTTPSLAATGGGDVSPLLPIGAGILVMGGLALLVTRRLVRH